MIAWVVGRMFDVAWLALVGFLAAFALVNIAGRMVPVVEHGQVCAQAPDFIWPLDGLSVRRECQPIRQRSIR